MEDVSVNLFSDCPSGLAPLLRSATVGIAGAGGIGSNVAWLLARAGTGRLVVADHDVVETSNLNRQFYFLDQVGRPKTEALGENLKRINPGLELVLHRERIVPGNACSLFREADLLVEALDRESVKVMLLESWLLGLPGIPVVACSGLAGEGGTDDVRVDRRSGLTIVGDQSSDLSLGTLSSRVCLVASMMANEAISLLRAGLELKTYSY